MRTAPQYCLNHRGVTTQRAWRRLKRRELEQARQAIAQLRLGCFFTPNGRNGETVQQIADLLDALALAWSPANWGR